MHSRYYDRSSIAEAVAAGHHREVIGGLWDELGNLQLNFLVNRGVKPTHRVLDIGCGSLRFGVRAVEYLNAGMYWGTDLSQDLIEAGYDEEIVPAGLSWKLPRANLLTDAEFEFRGIPGQIDVVIAQSVFTHLPIDLLRTCLSNLAGHVEGRCTFFATFFVVDDVDLGGPFRHEPGAVVTHQDSDPYHHSLTQIAGAAQGSPWSIEYIGDWGHPRSQQMVAFHKE